MSDLTPGRFLQLSALLLIAILTTACQESQPATAPPPPKKAQWFQFQGPQREGQITGQRPAQKLNNRKERLLWSAPLHSGYAGPAVSDNRVFITDRDLTVPKEKGADDILCLDLASGKLLWKFSYLAPGDLPSYKGSRGTPTYDSGRLYNIGPFGDFYCLNAADGKPLWKHHILTLFQAKMLWWGVSQSPVVYKDFIIVAPQSKQHTLAAFRNITGEMVWKSPPLVGEHGYMSPLLITVDGMDQVVMVSSGQSDGKILPPRTSQVAGFHPLTGEILWIYKGWNCPYPIALPTYIGKGRLFLTGGYKAGSVLIEISRQGEVWSVKELFKAPQWGSQIHQALYCDGTFYFNDNDNEKLNGMMALSLEGKQLWRTKDNPLLPRFGRANMILVDGLIFALDERKGALKIIRPNPAKYEELDSFILFPNDRELFAPLAVTDGKLLLRSKRKLVCLDISER